MAARSSSRSRSSAATRARSRTTPAQRPGVDDVIDAELDEELSRLAEWPDETAADATEGMATVVDVDASDDAATSNPDVAAESAGEADAEPGDADGACEADEPATSGQDVTRSMDRALALFKRGRPGGHATDALEVAAHIGQGPIASALRYVLNRYELAEATPLPQSIAVVSSLRGEGVSTISRALSEVLASDFNARVCWIDFSWTGPQHRRRGANADPAVPGMYEVVTETATIDDVLIRHGDSNLFALRVGAVPNDQRSAMVRWDELRELVAQLRREFDYLVLDVAPVLSDPDALALMRFADAQVLVARHAAVSVSQIEAVTKDLGTIPLLGAVLNKYTTNTPRFIRRFFAG